MYKPYLLLLLVASSFTACKKDKTHSAAAPIADFTFDSDKKASNITINESTWMSLSNTSKNATSYLWDYGDGTTSTDETGLLSLKSGGSYTVSLTAKNASGQSSTIKKQVKVVAPVLQTITIKKLDWTVKLRDMPDFKTADVWIEITKSEEGKNYPRLASGIYDAPVIYKSKIYKNATIHSAPFELSTSESVKLNQNTIMGSNGRYSVNLYARDVATGITYLVYSPDITSGIATGPYLGDFEHNEFTWNTGGGYNCTIVLSGAFE